MCHVDASLISQPKKKLQWDLNEIFICRDFFNYIFTACKLFLYMENGRENKK